MENANTPQTSPENSPGNQADREQKSSDKLQTITDACATMKDEIASEAEHTILGTDKMGKPPTFTEVCAVMKDRMADEAEQIVGVPPRIERSQGAGSEAKSSEREQPHSQQIEQAKMALKEANWFEQ